MIRILLVDDQKSIREVLRVMLDLDAEMTVVGTASDGYTAIEQVEILQPDLVLIDIEMPSLDGFAATKSICETVPGIKVLILSMHKSDEYVSKSLDAGAAGYLLKSTPAHELRESIRFIFKEEAQLSPQGVEDWWGSAKASGNGSVNGNGSMNGKPLSTPSIPFDLPLTARSSQPETQKLPVSSLLDSHGFLPGLSFRSASPQLTKTLDVSASGSKIQPLLYWGLGLFGILSVWGVSLLYLWKTPPTYTSQWTITLPSSGSSARVDLPGIGQATSENESPYNSQSSDPRETYKTLALTDEVLDVAANQAGLTTQEFGKPRVQVVLNTTLMRFQISGETPQIAQRKGLMLHDAFKRRLNQLRKQEVAQKDQGLEGTLSDAKRKLAIARQKLTEFQTRTGLDSSEQLRDLSLSTEQLRRQKAEVSAQLEQAGARSQRLSQDLGLTVAEVSDAFSLDSDALFQQYLANYNQASAAVVSLRSQFNANHPAVLDQLDAQRSAERALLIQGRATLGRSVSLAYIRKLSLNQNSGVSNRESLFQELVLLKNQERGLKEQSQELERQIRQFEQKLKRLSGQNATLLKLERDVKIAEAIFSSTLTQQDLGQASLSASYPPVSMITKPNLPKEPSSPKTSFVLAGALLSSLFILSGVAALWWRDSQGTTVDRHRQNNSENKLPTYSSNVSSALTKRD